MKTKKSNTKDITILGLFIALMAVLAFVPYIGFIPLTPAISLSIVHLPAIVGTIILGFKKGMIIPGFRRALLNPGLYAHGRSRRHLSKPLNSHTPSPFYYARRLRRL